MKLLRTLKKILGELSGDTDYARYCEHLRARHPEVSPPTAKQFYLARLDEKYARPNRCC